MMKTTSKYISLFYLLLVLFSCKNENTEKNQVVQGTIPTSSEETFLEQDESSDNASSEDFNWPDEKPSATENEKDLLADTSFEMKPESNNINTFEVDPKTEIISKRDRTSKHYMRKDGKTIDAILSPRSVHFRNQQGEWEDINTNLIPSEMSDYAFENTTNNLKSWFPTDATNDGVIVRTEDVELLIGKNFTLSWIDVNGNILKSESFKSASPKIKGNTISYTNVLPKINNEYIIQEDEIKHNFVLEEKPMIPEGTDFMFFGEDVELPNNYRLEFDQNHLGLVVINDKNEVYLEIPEPTVYGENNERITADENYASFELKKLEGVGNKYTIITKISAQWLDERTYPLVIDPTLILNGNTSGYIWFDYYRYYNPGGGNCGDYENNETINYIAYNSTSARVARNRNYNYTIGSYCRRYCSWYYNYCNYYYKREYFYDYYKGWIKYNTSSIPDVSTISAVEFSANVTGEYTDNLYTTLYSSNGQGGYSTSTNNSQYNDITYYNHGYAYYSTPGQYPYSNLGSANTRLQALLPNDYFQIGLLGNYTTSGSPQFKTFNTSLSTLRVTYQNPCEPITEAPTNPFPYNASTDVCYDGGGAVTALGWTAVPEATLYDVYFGTSPTPGLFQSDLTTTYTTQALNLSANTTYYWSVVPKNDCGTFTNVSTWSFTTAATPCADDYCEVTYDNVNPITNISFATIDNASSASTSSPSYENFTPLSATISEGSTQTLTVEANSGTTGTTEEMTLYITAFFDWNQNGDFTDAGEVYQIGTIYNSTGVDGISTSFDITVPLGSGVTIGNTTMRVMASRYNYNTNPCEPVQDGSNPTFGQTEDYSVNICALPTASCKNITLELNEYGNASITAADLDDDSTASCGVQSLTISQSSFDCTHIGLQTVDLTITDVFGNSATCQANVDVLDITAPSLFDSEAESLIVECDGAGNTADLTNWLNTNGGAIAMESCSDVTWTNDFAGLTDNCGETGSTFVVFTATDDYGNYVQTSAVFSIIDTSAPTLSGVPDDVTIECDALPTDNPTSVDTCDASPTITLDEYQQYCQFADAYFAGAADWTDLGGDGFGEYIRYNDNNTGNAGSFIGSSGQIDSNGRAFGLWANGDTCNIVRFFDTGMSAGDSFGIEMDNGSINNGGTVGFALQNASAGNLLEFYFVGGDSNYYLNGLGGPIDTGIGFTNQGLSLYITIVSATSAVVEITELSSGNVTTIPVDLLTSGDQTISKIRMFNANAGGGSDHDAFFNRIQHCVESSTPPSGVCASNYNLTKIWTVADECGNSSNGVQIVTVQDTTAPSISCPSNINVNTDPGVCGAIVSYTVSHSDTCGNTTIQQTAGLASGETFPVGTTTNSFIVTDECGNTSTCTFDVLVEDNEAPEAICQSGITVQLDANGQATITAADVDDGSNDACGIASLSIDNNTFDCSDIASGSSGPQVWINEIHYDNTGGDVGEFVEVAGTAGLDLTGYSIVKYNGNDGSSYGTNLLLGYIIDDEGSGFGAVHISYPSNGLQNGAPDGVALVGPSGVLEFLSYEGTFTAVGGPADGLTSTDIGVSENGSEAIGNSLQRTGDQNSGWTGPAAQSPGDLNTGQSLSSGANTVTLTVTDNNGNTSTCTATVTVLDEVAPTVVCNPITVELDASGNYTLSQADIDALGNGSTDACGIASIEADITSFDCNNVGANNVTITVTDNNGNSATCVAVVNVEDNTAPNAVCQDITVQLDANGQATITAADVDGGSNDACGITSLSIDNNTFDCDDIVLDNPVNPITDLFISEYVEGSSFNKYLEIYNGTGVTVDLSDYEIRLYSNGSNSISADDTLSGTLADGAVIVYSNSSANAYGGTTTNLGVINWNGDDTVVLWKISTGEAIDIIGKIGEDPGSAWNVSGASTANTTLVRNNNIYTGNTDDASGFPSLATEWTASATDDVSNLGSHSVNVGGSSNNPQVTLTVTDANGNVSSCIATVTVEDNLPPTAVCQSFTVLLDENGNGTLTASDIDGGSTDNCGIALLEADITDFTCANVGNNTVTLTVTDFSGNVSTCQAQVSVVDTIAPTVACQGLTVELDANGQASITAQDLDAGSTDACGIASITASQTSFDCSDLNSTVAITDLFISEYVEGSSSNKYIEIYNGTGASVNLSDYELRLHSNGNPNPSTTNSLSGTLANGDVIVYSNSSANIYGGSTTSLSAVNWNGDDAIVLWKISESAAVDIFGKVGEDPGTQWNVAGNETQNQTLRRNSTVTKGNTNDLNGFPSLGTEWTELAIDDVSGLGVHTVDNAGVEVTLTVTDIYGNAATCTAVVNVQDNIVPTISCVADSTRDTDLGSCDYTVQGTEFDATFADNCSDAFITNDYNGLDTLAGEELPQGPTTIIWTVDDGHGQTASCSITITVEDNEAPVIECQDFQIYLDSESATASITDEDVAAFVEDNCEVASISLSQYDFDCSDTGGDLDELFISEYIDGPGNNDFIEIFNATGNTVVLGEVVGGTTLVSYYTLNIYPNGSTTPISIGLLGTIDDRQTYIIAHPGNDTGILYQSGAPSMVFDGNDAVELSHDGSPVDIIGIIGNNPGTGWTSGGNSTQATTLVRNIDVLQGNTVDFLGGLATEWNQSVVSYGFLGDHDIEITDQANNIILTVVDTSGNVSTCEANVTVIDNTPPVAICQNVTVQLDATGNGSTSAQLVNNGSNDLCGIKSLELSQTDFDCSHIGPNTVTLTVTDNNGNTATCTATVTVEDNVAPDVHTQDITVQLDANGNASITASQVDDNSSDACGLDTITVSPSSFTCSEVGDNTVTLTVVDVNGNSASATATVTVEDNVDPVAVCQNITVTLDSNGYASIIGEDVDGGSTDACGIVSYSVTPFEFGCDQIGDNTVTLTVTDSYGNTDTCTATVTVEGIIPTVSISQGPLPDFCQGAVVVLTADSPEAISYLWTTGETTESIEVAGNGTYGVTVTSATNCTTYEEFTVTGFDAGTLVSSYTILGYEEVFLHGSNLVQSGAVGAMNNNGLIKLHQASTIVDFGQAANFVLNQGSTIGTQVFQPANPTIPPFVFNTQSNASSPDVTINAGQSQTLNGSVYGTITVKQNATVTFSESNVYIDELKTFDGASIEFTGCANVYINDKFTLAQNGTINATGNYVVFYVNQDVQIEKGSYVRAKIHSNGNELLAKGANGNGNNAAEPTEMIGMFIANKVHGSVNVIWNADTFCDPCPTDAPAAPIAGNTGGNAYRADFDVLGWPNPSDTKFTIKLKSLDMETKTTVQVFDMDNKLVHSASFSPAQEYSFGYNLEGGVYIIKVDQGNNTKTIRLVKY